MPKKTLSQIDKSALQDITKIKDVKSLETVHTKYLGRQDGELTAVLRSLAKMSDVQKRKIGPGANALRQKLESAFNQKLSELNSQSSTSNSQLDITMPGKKVPVGSLHPLTIIENKIREIFRSLGFSVVEGPELETEYYNFDALNIPANHPARDMWDTFWLSRAEAENGSPSVGQADPAGQAGLPDNKQGGRGQFLMRTHTSPMQIRYMEKHQPPFQIIVPGRVFRFEATDASHEINFHQVEGLMVGPNVSLANFKYIMTEFFKRFFGVGVEVRFRPSYFPFVKPGLEVDIK
ncbi:MAG: phenylalanine--tRNA ligase subunit alpha, partial [Patescibacteria group bacterium]